jgi:hypothetical protein
LGPAGGPWAEPDAEASVANIVKPALAAISANAPARNLGR